MTAQDQLREFWVTEFNHPSYGWSMVGYPRESHALAQAEIAHRLCFVAPKRREQASRDYRVVRYVPDPGASEPQP